MGRLKWVEPVAMSADPQSILLALQGHWEEMEDLERIAYGAQGIKLPPRENPFAKKPSLSDRFKQFAAYHNATHRPKKRAKPG